jgi:O-antigen ligase
VAGTAAVAVTGSSPRVQAAVLLFLAVPQLYLLPEGTVDIALSTLVTMVLLAGYLWRLVRQPARPLPHLGLFAVVMSAALRTDPGLLTYVQRVYWPWVVAEACLVVVFRFAPGVEDAFLRSIGGLFAGQNTVAALFGDGRNNVFDPAKAGGVFVNANVAAMFLGVNGLAALAAYLVTRTRWVAAVGVFCLVAVLFTGSKSAGVLAFTLPVLAIGAYLMSRPGTSARRRYLMFGGVSAGAAAIVAAICLNAGLRDQMIEAFVGRTVIWGFGAQSFRDEPVLGLGYGGWDAGFGPYAAAHGLDRSFPPHNLLLAAWSSTGIAGLVLTVAFIVVAFWLVFRGLSGRAGTDRRFAALAGAAVTWVFVQGMGENTDVFGEIHLIPVLALLFAYLIPTAAIPSHGEETEGIASQAHRWNRATPAVPEVGDVHPQPGDGAAAIPAALRGEGQGPGHAGSRLG